MWSWQTAIHLTVYSSNPKTQHFVNTSKLDNWSILSSPSHHGGDVFWDGLFSMVQTVHYWVWNMKWILGVGECITVLLFHMQRSPPLLCQKNNNAWAVVLFPPTADSIFNNEPWPVCLVDKSNQTVLVCSFARSSSLPPRRSLSVRTTVRLNPRAATQARHVAAAPTTTQYVILLSLMDFN